jgi:hypothetical protein
MKNYVWKQNHPSLGGNKGNSTTASLGKYSDQIGRFRLKPKSAVLSTKARGETQDEQDPISLAKRADGVLSKATLAGSLLERQVLHGPQFTMINRLNPFDITLLNLGPKSENLITYCTFEGVFIVQTVQINQYNDARRYSVVHYEHGGSGFSQRLSFECRN